MVIYKHTHTHTMLLNLLSNLITSLYHWPHTLCHPSHSSTRQHTHTHSHNNRGQQWRLATVEIWPRQLFESEPNDLSITLQQEAWDLFIQRQDDQRQREPGKKAGNLEWSPFTCVLSNIRVYVLCPVVWTWGHRWHLSPLASSVQQASAH